MLGVVDKSFFSNISSKNPLKLRKFKDVKENNILFLTYYFGCRNRSTKCKPVYIKSDLFTIVHQWANLYNKTVFRHIVNHNWTEIDYIYLWMSIIYICFTFTKITCSLSIYIRNHEVELISLHIVSEVIIDNSRGRSDWHFDYTWPFILHWPCSLASVPVISYKYWYGRF
jgi:hypothetical protein